jgi:hypothetical protein
MGYLGSAKTAGVAAVFLKATEGATWQIPRSPRRRGGPRARPQGGRLQFRR